MRSPFFLSAESMSILKKTDYEKKSTRERYRIERSELYFKKSSGNTPYILFAFAIIVGIYAYFGGGPLHFVAALFFTGLSLGRMWLRSWPTPPRRFMSCTCSWSIFMMPP